MQVCPNRHELVWSADEDQRRDCVQGCEQILSRIMICLRCGRGAEHYSVDTVDHIVIDNSTNPESLHLNNVQMQCVQKFMQDVKPSVNGMHVVT